MMESGRAFADLRPSGRSMPLIRVWAENEMKCASGGTARPLPHRTVRRPRPLDIF